MTLIESPPPFQREIREWQKTDLNTGLRLSGRIEAHRFNAGPLKKYGQLVDSKNIIAKDGSQLTQRKQLDVFQGRSLTGGSVQVVKTTTVLSATTRKSSSLHRNNNHNINHHHHHKYQDNNHNDSDTVVLKPKLLMITDNISDSYNQYATAKSIQRDIVNLKKLPNKNGDSEHSDNGIKSSYSATTTSSNNHLKNASSIVAVPQSSTNKQMKPKIPVRRRKSPIAKVIQQQSTNDLPGSFKCLTKVKKDLENTRKQNILNPHLVMAEEKNENDHQKIVDQRKIYERLSVADANKPRQIISSTHSTPSMNDETYNKISSHQQSFERSTSKPNSNNNGLSRIEKLIENGRRRSNRNIVFTPANKVNNETKIISRTSSSSEGVIKPQPTKSTTFLPATDTNSTLRTTSNIIINSKNNNEYNNTAKICINDQQSSFIQMDVESNENQMKRVKFCKTEVHFTAETGRICIVETDSKPPAMKLQRRNRYRSGYAKLTKESSGKTISERTTSSSISSVSPPKLNQTLSISNNPSTEFIMDNNDNTDSCFSNNAAMDSNEDEVRGILKNRLIKPKTYLFGENYNTENSAKFWGVRLKPVSIVTTKGSLNSCVVHQNQNQMECSNCGGDASPLIKRHDKKDQILITVKRREPLKSVNNVIKSVSGFSTKINLNGGSNKS